MSAVIYQQSMCTIISTGSSLEAKTWSICCSMSIYYLIVQQTVCSGQTTEGTSFPGNLPFVLGQIWGLLHLEHNKWNHHIQIIKGKHWAQHFSGFFIHFPWSNLKRLWERCYFLHFADNKQTSKGDSLQDTEPGSQSAWYWEQVLLTQGTGYCPPLPLCKPSQTDFLCSHED